MTMLDVALGLAAQGYAVFPCRPNAKQPLHKGGFHNATMDVAQIKEWWSNVPLANPAIYPEACKPRLLVIDVDIKGNSGGDRAWKFLRAELQLEDPGMVVQTPSGGRHHYYSLDGTTDPVQSSASRIAPGIDVRSAGGYVLAPGSIVDGRPYTGDTWLSADAVPPVQPLLVQRAREGSGNAGLSGSGSMALAEGLEDWDLPSNIERARVFLKKEIGAGQVAIEGQGGGDFTYRTAAVVRDFGLSENTCFDLLVRSGWNRACDPPWPVSELDIIIHNVYQYAKRPAGEARTANHESMAQMVRQAKAAEKSSEVVKKKNPFAFKWRDDVEAMEDPAWLITDVIPEQSLIFLYGPQRTYKSFIVLDMLARCGP